MSASQYRRQLENKRKQRVEAEKKAGEYRAKESTKRAAAGKAQQAAAKAKSDTTIKNKLREAERRETEAQKAGKDANTWQSRAAGYQKDEIALQAKLAKAEQSEAEAAQRQRGLLHDLRQVGYAAVMAGVFIMVSYSTGVNRPRPTCRRRR